MGERADQLNDYEQAPYIPGGYTPQGDERSEPPSGETAGFTEGKSVAGADLAARNVAGGNSAAKTNGSGDVDMATGAAASTDPDQIRGDIADTSTQMSGTIDEIQGQLSPQHLKTQAADTVKQSAMQAKDTASQKLQEVASQVNEKAGPVVQQAAAQARGLGDQAQRQARMVRDKYDEFQERTGIEITPRMLGIAAGVLAGVVALIAVIGRLRGQSAEEEDDVIVADLPLDTLPNGNYRLTRID